MKALQISTPFLSVGPNIGYGGTERIVYLLDQELNLRGNSAGVVAPRGSQPASRLYPTLERSLGESCVVDGHSSSDSEGLYGRLEHIAQAINQANQVSNADIVHIHDDNMFAFGYFLNKPSLMTLHTYYQAFWDPSLHSFVKTSKTKLVAISEAQKKLYESRGIPISYVVHHGVDEDLFETGDKENFLLNIGNIHPMKGQYEILLAGRNTGFDVVLAGTVGDYKYFKEKIRRFVTHDLSDKTNKYEAFLSLHKRPRNPSDPRLFFLGEVNDVQKKPFFSHAKAFLMPINVEEPFGLVMVEAMMSGTPVIAYNKGAVPELVEEGKTGFIVKDLEEMTNAISRASEINSEECRMIAVKKFSKGKMAKNYIQVYQDILDKRNK